MFFRWINGLFYKFMASNPRESTPAEAKEVLERKDFYEKAALQQSLKEGEKK